MSLTVAAAAQGTAFEWLRIGRNPAAAGMAGAGYASLSQGAAYSVNGNPAVAPLVENKLSAGASYSVVPSGEGTRGVTAAGASWNSGKFSVSAAYIGGKYPTVEFASDGGGAAGSYAPSDLMVAWAWALPSAITFPLAQTCATPRRTFPPKSPSTPLTGMWLQCGKAAPWACRRAFISLAPR